MAGVLVKTIEDTNIISELVNKKSPTYRQAYSDRTAWLMSCFAELAYIKFNPICNNHIKDYLTKMFNEPKENHIKVMSFLKSHLYDHNKEKETLENELEHLNAKLVQTFDSNGTQCFLAQTEDYLVLAFRGTESTSIKDIKTDLKANTISCETPGKIHSGFKAAFDEVAVDIKLTLDKPEFSHLPLMITGHSLGGALATVASKIITHKGGNAACYTFGSPRVGDEEWISSIKTPLYRVVNAADCVTMMPPGDDAISILTWPLTLMMGWGQKVRQTIVSKFGGYLHAGNMRYLTNCKNGDYRNVKLLYSVTLFRRLKMIFVKSLPWKKTLGDHSISVYRQKLKIVAFNRN